MKGPCLLTLKQECTKFKDSATWNVERHVAVHDPVVGSMVARSLADGIVWSYCIRIALSGKTLSSVDDVLCS